MSAEYFDETTFDSPLGRMLIATTSKGICRLTFDDSEASLQRLFPNATIVEDEGGMRELVEGALTAIEIDRDLARTLAERFPTLALIQGDALRFDYGALFAGQEKWRIVGNLPYNISSPLLFRLAECADRVIDQHFMLQKEVVDRMVAPPGSKTYGRLSVMLQLRYRMTKLFDVPRGAFNPPPKVTSSIVRMVPRPRNSARARMASANAWEALQLGVRRFDASLGRVIPLEERVSLCVKQRMRGTPPRPGSPGSVALLVFLKEIR